MPTGRPSIPRDLERRVLIEAGHRCAIPTCRATPVELAHIAPWSKVKEHRFENLIALCPTCHGRFDRGEIDHKAMLLYKEGLRRQESATKLLRVDRVTTYLDFARAIDRWASSIGDIELVDVAFERGENRGHLVEQCCVAAAKANGVLVRFSLVHESEVGRSADDLYRWVLSWADDVVDGLWPSTHMGATPHDGDDLADVELALMTAVANEVAMTVDELNARVTGVSPRLGGTGKRF
jgi:hypothetical protein